MSLRIEDPRRTGRGPQQKSVEALLQPGAAAGVSRVLPPVVRRYLERRHQKAEAALCPLRAELWRVRTCSRQGPATRMREKPVCRKRCQMALKAPTSSGCAHAKGRQHCRALLLRGKSIGAAQPTNAPTDTGPRADLQGGGGEVARVELGLQPRRPRSGQASVGRFLAAPVVAAEVDVPEHPNCPELPAARLSYLPPMQEAGPGSRRSLG
jgi:hypothetical protein